MEISSTSTEMSSDETLEEELFKNVMLRDWKEVVKIYDRDKRAHKMKITMSGQTALHVAVFDASSEIVEKMVELIKKNYSQAGAIREVLELKNDKGHTPLNIAAAIGNVRVCKCIAGVDKKLLHARDDNSETPLFRAVHYGRYEAFLFLHSLLDDDLTKQERYHCCKKTDGQTILHEAIIREHFDLAFLIIQRDNELVNYVDEEGNSPLHVLGEKAYCF